MYRWAVDHFMEEKKKKIVHKIKRKKNHSNSKSANAARPTLLPINNW